MPAQCGFKSFALRSNQCGQKTQYGLEFWSLDLPNAQVCVWGRVTALQSASELAGNSAFPFSSHKVMYNFEICDGMLSHHDFILSHILQNAVASRVHSCAQGILLLRQGSRIVHITETCAPKCAEHDLLSYSSQ